nr:CHASE2 domain-containing protein [Neptuniibacter sp.]
MAGLSSMTSWFDRLSYDALSQHYQPFSLSANQVVLIDIDEASIRRLSGWPIERGVHAKVIEHLTQAGASSVTYNVAFVVPNTGRQSQDSRLLAAVKNNGRVVLPMLAESGDEMLPLGLSQIDGALFAHADLPVDQDGVLRRNYLLAGIAYPRWPSLSLATLKTFAPVKADDYSGLRSPYLNIGFSKQWSRDFEVFLPLGIERFLPQVRRFSLSELLDDQIEPALFKDKAIFVGINNSTIEKKFQLTNGNSYSATEVQAYLFSGLNQGYALSPSLPVWATSLALVTTLSFGLICLVFLPIWVKLLLVGVLGLGVVLPVLLLKLGFWISYFPMLVGLMGVLLVLLLGKLIQQKQKSPA